MKGCAYIALLLLATPFAWAQSITGSIVGTVIDSTQAVIPGAKVTLRHNATGAIRNAVTNEAGRFVFASLQPGEYELAIEAQGFKRLERTGINLAAAETLSLGNLVMELGALAEVVKITAQGAPVQLESSERAGLLSASQVENLTIRGRNVLSLLSLLPGVVSLSEPDALNHAWDLRVLGNRQNTINVSLDGATLNAYGNQFNSVVNISMDAVAEVKVLLSNYQAEYGRLSGANVHIVSKSGTKEFHGLASYWKRHEQFNANEFFNNLLGLPKPRYRYNTWNYNLGGPVYLPGKFNTSREKLFFFWAQEFWPLSQSTGLNYRTVPTGAERQGDFSGSLDVNNRLIVVTDSLARAPFPGNVVPPSRVDPNGQALLKAFPEPNFTDRSVSKGNYNYVFQAQQSNPKRTETLKLDFNANANNLVSFNFTERSDASSGTYGVGTGNDFPSVWTKRVNFGRAFLGRYQKIFSPVFVNELSLGYSTRPWDDTEVDPATLKNIQRSTWGFRTGQFHPEINPLGLLPNASFGGIPNAAQHAVMGRFPLKTTHKIFTFSNNLTRNFSRHIVKAGLYADRIWACNHGDGVTFNGSFNFGRNVNNPLDTNYAYANAILGVFNTYTEASARPVPEAILSNIEWFGQDNWRATKRLTLELGIRFYWMPHAFPKDGRNAGFWPAAYDPARAVKLIQPTRVGNTRVGIHPLTGQVYPADVIGAIAPNSGNAANGMVSHLFDRSVPASLMEDRGVHYAPRLGLAYDVFGNGKTALRGGLGVFYNRMAGGMVFFPTTTQPPIVENPILYFGTLPTLLSSSGFLFPSTVLGLDRQGKLPTVINYSFGIQQNVGFGTVFDVAYVASLGRHLLWQRNLNAVPLGANFQPANQDPTTGKPYPVNFLRSYAGYANINFRETGSSSNYHSLQVTATRRFTRGLEFGAAWTWSKTMDFNDSDSDEVSTLVPVRVWNYGLASFDRTHVFKLNWLWELPKLAAAKGLAGALVNGWQLSGIASFISGSPIGVGLSTTTALDITGSPTHGARVVVVGNPVLPKSQRTFYRYFRTDVFRLPQVGTVGNAAKTLLRGPGINNWDMAIYKNFSVRERYRIQFRTELYNTFNHTQFSSLDATARFDPAGNQVNARFGQITAARSARKLQLALRFTF